jgi:putative membrane protein
MGVTAAGALAQGAWNNHMWDAGWGWWMALMMVAFWGVVIWLVVTFVRNSEKRRPRHDEHLETAQAVLAERLARGEIDTAEYRERLDTLR